MRTPATLFGLIVFALAPALAADNGSAQLSFAGTSTPESFAPNRDVEVKDLGMLKGRDQFSVGWVMATSDYSKPDYKRLVFQFTAPKDGSAIQGFVLDFERGKEFAMYQPRCVLNTEEGCDIRAEGIDLDVKSKQIRFVNAKFYLASDKLDRFPAHVIVNGTLKY